MSASINFHAEYPEAQLKSSQYKAHDGLDAYACIILQAGGTDLNLFLSQQLLVNLAAECNAAAQFLAEQNAKKEAI
jgi:hypothetical protein